MSSETNQGRSDRAQRFAAVPGFAKLSGSVLEELAGAMKEERFAPGEIVVSEGDEGDRLHLVVEGRAEITTTKAGVGRIPLSTIGPGEIFGEIALLSETTRRQATVAALSPLLTLSLGADVFRRTLQTQPGVREFFEHIAEELLVAKFLKQASPFTTLDPVRARHLASTLQQQEVAAGETIIRQGEPGDSCYLLRSGGVEVLLQENDEEARRIATLAEGAIFGEAALLTDAPRNASVRAAQACRLLVLRRADLLEAMGADHKAGLQLMELLHLRDRPQRVEGVTTHPRTNPDGETITILKDAGRGAYYRLSAQGWFLWERLDGHHTLRDLTLDYFIAFKALSPQAVAEVLGGLAAAGFVHTQALRRDVMDAEAAAALPWALRLMLLARRILEFRVSWQKIDAPLTRWSARGVRLVFGRPGCVALCLLAFAGILAFALASGRAAQALHAMSGGGVALTLVVSVLVMVLFHEAGHAFAVKSFGREVPRAGLGWYWFSPIAFVDTSDMWLEGRWPRIAVNLAGIYINLALAGVTSLVACLGSDPLVTAICYEYSLLSYVLVLVNLNPLLEYDGYYVLMDFLERPNLRSKALTWLGHELPRAIREPGAFRGHWIDLIYGVMSIAYIAFMAVLTVVFYRLLVQDWMTRLLPPVASAALAWVLAGAVIVLSGAMVAGDLRGRGRRGA